MGTLIRDIIDNSAKKFANEAAVKWLNKKEISEISYSDLREEIVAVRKGLVAGDFQNTHIAIIGTTSIEWIQGYMGIVTGQAVAVPLDPGLPVADLEELINRADVEAVFLSPKLKGHIASILNNCPKIKKIWVLSSEEASQRKPASETTEALCKDNSSEGDNSSDRISTLYELKVTGCKAVADALAPAADDIATIIFTSGTTGKSKGVMLTQNNMAENVEYIEMTYGTGSVVLSVLPVHHAFCLVVEWLKGFSLGITICINDSLLHMIRNLSIFKPDVMIMVPMMIETIYKRLALTEGEMAKQEAVDKILGGRLKHIYTGGAHLDTYYIDKFEEYGIGIYEGYGMSECSPVISRNTPENFKPGSIGKPLKNAEIRFQNDEILVRGSSVMAGYYQMPAETAEAVQDGWLHTGDKGYLDEDGYLYINGRVKNLIILSNGENISPEEIEGKLALKDLVGEVIITGENNGLTARIYPEPTVVETMSLDADAVNEKLQSYLDDYNKGQPTYRQIIGLVVRKNPFNKNATKKIKRQEVYIDEP